MGWMDFLGGNHSAGGTIVRIGNTATITVDVPSSLYYKEMAIHTALSLIAAELAKATVRVFKGNEEVMDRDWYLLNISPNPNSTAFEMWGKLLRMIISDPKGGFLVEYNDYLYCPDRIAIKVENEIYGHIYSDVEVGTMKIPGTFHSNKLFRFGMGQERTLRALIDGLYGEYDKLITTIAKAVRDSNARKYKLHIESYQAGDEEFLNTFKDIISVQLKDFMEKDNAVYPEFDGYKLEPDPIIGTKTSVTELVGIKKDMFDTVANAFCIPPSMMTGTNTNVEGLRKSFLESAVDPFARCIEQGLNKPNGAAEYLAGNYYIFDTSCTGHYDPFAISSDVSGIVGSGLYCLDEIRMKMREQPLNTEWSRTHFMTKNFARVADIANGLEDGKGEVSDEP